MIPHSDCANGQHTTCQLALSLDIFPLAYIEHSRASIRQCTLRPALAASAYSTHCHLINSIRRKVVSHDSPLSPLYYCYGS
jgi:hypothetical protein